MGSEAFEVLGESDFWIGGHNLLGYWEWTDKRPFNFDNWISGKRFG